MSKENILTVQSAVRGFHVYKAIWQPEEGEKLIREHEENNKYDLYAIKMCRPLDRKIVGHLPTEISRITRFMIARGPMVEAQVKSTGKSSTGIKHKSNKPGSTDIRRWFKPASNKVNDPSTKKKRSEESSIIAIDHYFNITVVIKRETRSLLILVKVLYSPTCVL